MQNEYTDPLIGAPRPSFSSSLHSTTILEDDLVQHRTYVQAALSLLTSYLTRRSDMGYFTGAMQPSVFRRISYYAEYVIHIALMVLITLA